ncbi:MAG: dihydrodipicolinate synthase family protein [Vicinamibacterales bacterium]
MRLAGVLAPLPTPFDEQGDVDVRRLRAALARWVDSRLDGFVALGTTGEAGLLNEEESSRVIAETRALVPVGRTLLVGTARESTRQTVEATRRASALGADAALVRTPSAFAALMTAPVLERFYTEVADASPIPVFLYNFTAATGVTLTPDLVGRLADHPNIVGMKESGADVARIAELIAAVPDDFSVMAGSATTFYAAACAGASGGILALACVIPNVCARLYDLVRQGRHDDARAFQRRIAPLARLVTSELGVPGVKAALALVGVDAGLPRLPLTPVPDTAAAAIRRALLSLEDQFA